MSNFIKLLSLAMALLMLVGGMVADCIAKGKTLEDVTLDEYRAASELFDEDVYNEISLETCVGKRISAGSTGPESVKAQILSVEEFLQNEKDFY